MEAKPEINLPKKKKRKSRNWERRKFEAEDLRGNESQKAKNRMHFPVHGNSVKS